MATRVPALERASRILQFLARSPAGESTVSQVAAELGLSKATTFAQLVCLSELGWLTRDDERKTYRLGPELVHLGWASIDQVPGIEIARREMFALAAQLDVGCFACRLAGGDQAK
jgi:DNA-binding IclR family transcriptional regulator